MFEWPEKIKTQIESIDTHHRMLIDTLDTLCIAINAQALDEDVLNEILIELAKYEIHHFADQVQLIKEVDASEKFAIMEHSSFIYDIEKIRSYFSPDIDVLQEGKADIVSPQILLDAALKLRNQCNERNYRFKQHLAQSLVEYQLTKCLSENISANF
jgi:hemerythrin